MQMHIASGVCHDFTSWDHGSCTSYIREAGFVLYDHCEAVKGRLLIFRISCQALVIEEGKLARVAGRSGLPMLA